MSMLEGLASTLAEMSFVQLALVFLAVGAYSMAINGAFGSGARSGAASASFVAAEGAVDRHRVGADREEDERQLHEAHLRERGSEAFEH